MPDPVEKLVLLSLASHASNDGNCFPSVTRLCKRTGLSDRTVRRKVKSLIQHGYLKVNYNHGHSSQYHIQITPNTPVTQSGLPLSNGHPTPVTETVPPCQPDRTGTVTQSGIISKLNTVSETVRGIGVSPTDKILMEKSLERINKRLLELKDADLPNAVAERKSLKASRIVLLSKLCLPA